VISESVTAPTHADTGTPLPLWLYAVTATGVQTPPELLGVGEVPLRVVEHEDVAAIVSGVDPERPASGRRDLLAHSAVVDAARGGSTLVPVQFGSVLEDEDALRHGFLEPRREELLDLLRMLEGRSQFNVRARYIEDQVLAEIVRESPEVAELRRRTRDAPEELVYADKVRLGELIARRMAEKRGLDADLLLEVVVPQTVSHVVREVGGSDVLSLAVLVDDTAEEEFTDVMEALAEAVHERMRLELVGPLAPFDFTGGL
jgi:hypothetical protein